MLAVLGGGLGAAGAFYFVKDKQTRTPITESFDQQESRTALEKELQFQWTVVATVLVVYLLV